MSTNSDSKAWKPKDSTAASYDVCFFFFKGQRGKLGLEPPMKSSTFSSLASLDRSYMYIYIYTCMCAKLLQSRLTIFDSMDWACQPPLSMGFSRQEHWSGLPCPPPGGLPDPGVELRLLHLHPRWILHHWATREAHIYTHVYTKVLSLDSELFICSS